MTTTTGISTNRRCYAVMLILLAAFVVFAATSGDRIRYVWYLSFQADDETVKELYEQYRNNQSVIELEESNKNDIQPTSAMDEGCIINSTISREPPRNVIMRSLKSGIIWHMGKSGGDTVHREIRQTWNVSFANCHPRPCIGRTLELLEKENRTTVLFLLRDPVDRFLSAFYWRQIVLCAPQGESRTTISKDDHPPPGTEDYEHYCRGHGKFDKEAQVIFERYNREADVLARALCSSNRTVAEEAAEGMKHIAHSGTTITDWLGPKWSEFANSIYPIVLEHDFDLIGEVDDAVRYVQSIYPFENEERFAVRQCIVRHQRGDSESNIVQKRSSPHSSASIKKPLSEEGAKCIAQYYADDYEVLSKLKDASCKSTACRNAIKSILVRRRN